MGLARGVYEHVCVHGLLRRSAAWLLPALTDLHALYPNFWNHLEMHTSWHR